MPKAKPARKKPPAHDYKRAREETREAVREAAVDAAIELLEEQGPDAVTVRRVAAMVGASTQVIYTLFGGKPGLAGAVFGRGHELLREALETAPRGGTDPLADFREQGRAYRQRMLANPNLYRVMFGEALGEMIPDERAQAAAQASFGALVESVVECQESGQMRAGEALEIARVIFSGCHGSCSLELTGRRPPDLDPAEFYEDVLETLLSGLAPGATTAEPEA